MELIKAHFDIDGSSLKFSVPFMKVDQEHRTVSGFATLDNVDRQGDVVSTSASLEAFNDFRGNLREMHQSKAVGRVMSFSVEEFYDPTSEKIYSGIWVTAYISKGAEDTWEKVLDGTLSGFSIGGEIQDVENMFDKASNTMVRHITKYSLIELSVVDSPANQLANIFSIVKTADGTTYKGLAVETKTENIFWCGTHQVAVIKDAESSDCAECSKPMENIGWVEKDDLGKADAIRTLIKNYEVNADQLENNLGEGGKQMQKENNDAVVEETAVVEKSEVVETVSDAVVEETVVAAEEAAEEVVEKAADVDEIVDEQPDLLKMVGEIREFVSTVEKSNSVHAEELATLAKSVSENSATFSATLSEISAKHDALSQVVADLSAAIEGVTEKVKQIDEADAIKKSGDLGRSAEVTKSDNIWTGAFHVHSR